MDQDLNIALVVGSLHSPRPSLLSHLSHAPPSPTLPPLLPAMIPLPPNFHLNPTSSVMPVTSSRAPSSHPEAHASFRGPFSSLPSMGDSSPTLAGLPTQISDSILPYQWSCAHRGREVNGYFKEAEASTLQDHDCCSANPGKSRPPRPHRPAGFATLLPSSHFTTLHRASRPAGISRKPSSV